MKDNSRVGNSILSVRRMILLVYLFSISLSASFGYIHASTFDSTRSILIGTDQITPLDILRGDTVRNDDDYYSGIPGAIGAYTTSMQDSNYTRALRMKAMIPLSARLSNDLREFSPLIPAKQNKITLEEQANNVLNLPSELYMPLKVDVANYQYGLMMSQNNVTGIRVMNPFGLKISLASIGQFFGLSEDVSPVIKYSLDYRTDVEVLIYSLNATAVATIFDGMQIPGKYTFTWNGRDDAGRRLSKGDYIAEVRIGKERYIRKRIVIR